MLNWSNIKDHVIKFLRGHAVKLALKKILGSAAAGGFKGWLVSFVVKELYDEIAEPIIRLGFRKAGYVYNKVNGEIQVKRLERARGNNDEQTYDDVSRDILS